MNSWFLYIDVEIDVCVYVSSHSHTRISWLCLLRELRSKDTLVAVNTPRAQILIVNVQGTRAPWRNGRFWGWGRKIAGELEVACGARK